MMNFSPTCRRCREKYYETLYLTPCSYCLGERTKIPKIEDYCWECCIEVHNKLEHFPVDIR